MKRLSVLVLATALTVMAADRTLTGSWKISINVAGESHEATCTFHQDGEKLTGTCKGESGEGALTGQIQAEKITWQNQVPYNGDTLTLTYTGAFSSDTEIKGDINVAPYDIAGDFTGQKVGAPAAAPTAPAASRTIIGSWKISINVAGESHEATCTFQQAGEKLTGTCKGESGEGALTGQIQAEKITWQHQVPYNGDTLTLTYTGAFSSDTEIKGDINVAPYDVAGDFTGTKVVPPPDK